MSLSTLLSRPPRALLGCLAMLAGTVLFACMHTTVRLASENLHPLEVVFFRNIFGLLALAPWFYRYGFSILRTARPRLHVLRSGLNVVAMSAFFIALTMTPLAKVQTLTFTAPIFTMLLAASFLGEKIDRSRWLAVAVAACGTCLVLRPGAVPIDTGSLLVIGSAAVWGLTMIVIKKLSATDPAVTITAWMVILMSIFSAIPALAVWRTPNGIEWLWLLSTGILGTFAQLLLTQSFRLADATLVLPIDFAKVVWGAILGWWIFGEALHPMTFVGAIIIFSTATWITLRERGAGRSSSPEAIGKTKKSSNQRN